MEYRQPSSWGSSNTISSGSSAISGGKGQDTRMNNDIDAIKVELAKAEAMLGSMTQPGTVQSTYTTGSSFSNGKPDAFIEEELKKVGSLLQQKNSSSSGTFSSFGSSHVSPSGGSVLTSSFTSGSFQPNTASKLASGSYSVEYQSSTASKPVSDSYSSEYQSSTAARPVSSSYSSEYLSSTGAGPVSGSYSSEYQSSSASKPVGSSYSSEYQSSTASKPVGSSYSVEYQSSTASKPVGSSYSSEYQSSVASKPVNSSYSVEYQSSTAARPVNATYSSEYQGSAGGTGAVNLPCSQNAESFDYGLQQRTQQSTRAEVMQSSQQQLLNKQKEIEAQMEQLTSAVKMMEGGLPRDSITVTQTNSSTYWEPNTSAASSYSLSSRSLLEDRREEHEEMKPKAVSWADLKSIAESETDAREKIETAIISSTAQPVGLWDFTLPPGYRSSNTASSSGSPQAEALQAGEASLQASSAGALSAGRSWETSGGSSKLDSFGDADLAVIANGSRGATSECCGRVQAEAAALREKVQGMDELLKSQSRKMMLLHKQLDEKEQENMEMRAQLQKLQAQGQSSSWSSVHSTSTRRMPAGGSTDYPLLRLAGTQSTTQMGKVSHAKTLH